jgi:hypothetical protein
MNRRDTRGWTAANLPQRPKPVRVILPVGVSAAEAARLLKEAVAKHATGK